MSMDTGSGGQKLLAEQIDYYRAVAAEYFDGQLDEGGGDELVTVIDEFAPTGDVLELACGPGTWTPQLLTQASCEQPRGPARDCEPVVYTLLATTM
jgi:hypothetical protein